MSIPVDQVFDRSCFAGHEFDLEAVGVGEVGGVVIGTAHVGMRVGEQQCPAVCWSFGGEEST
jgi:hypothetical protein